MADKKQRIYKYDNVKAFLIFLVVVGHMTTDYVSDSHLVRWTTLWIYMFHMPAFIFISGLVHKQYKTEEATAAGIKGEKRFRSDKVLGFFLCGYVLKIFLQLTRTLMGQNPLWHWIAEPGIPWYLFVMAEYEALFYLLRKIDGGGRLGENSDSRYKVLIGGAFALSAVIGYFPIVGDVFCLSRMINFLPIYMLGYYMDMRKFLELIDQKICKQIGSAVIVISLLACRFMPWGGYSLRKWFTGRRSYEFLSDFFGSYAVVCGWAIRLLVWAVAILITFAIISVIPNKDMGYITVIGARTLNIYFWHRPVCYLFRNWAVLPKLCLLFGGTYDESVAGQVKGLAFGGSSLAMIAAFAVYLIIAAGMTAFFGLDVFRHPCSDLMKLAVKLTRKKAL